MELLIVVIVIGVLAGVGIPKMKRVLETRRTTEAEEILAAVRAEQEKRCIAGKNYQTAIAKLESLATAGRSKNYTYTLQNTGASAEAAGYSLKILSYQDGRICCAGAGCDALNKNYPSCEDMTVPENDECAPGENPSEPEPDPDCINGDMEQQDVPCGCNEEGLKSQHRTCVDGSWGAWTDVGGCSAPAACPPVGDCSEGETKIKEDERSCGCHGRGKMIIKQEMHCEYGYWRETDGTIQFGECDTPDCVNCNGSVNGFYFQPDESGTVCECQGTHPVNLFTGGEVVTGCCISTGEGPKYVTKTRIEPSSDNACCGTITCVDGAGNTEAGLSVDYLAELRAEGYTCTCDGVATPQPNCTWHPTGGYDVTTFYSWTGMYEAILVEYKNGTLSGKEFEGGSLGLDLPGCSEGGNCGRSGMQCNSYERVYNCYEYGEKDDGGNPAAFQCSLSDKYACQCN